MGGNHASKKLSLCSICFLLLFLVACGSPDVTSDSVVHQLPSQEAQDENPRQLYTATPGTALRATEVPPSGEISNPYDLSVLTDSQKDRLYRASLEYLADTEAEAVRVARNLQFVDDEGHPANFCGPLSIGILRDAGLVDRYTDLHEFWLLNPREDYTINHILERTFPVEDYLWFRSEVSIRDFDFAEFPLYTGDFLYLYAGPKGTFEHILTVSRVDDLGRAYAITAETKNGNYLISELMLYDPANPGVGYFYDITNPDYSLTLGTTGFGGFQLWRAINPIPDPSPEESAFQSRMDKVFDLYGGEWHVLVKEVGGDILYALDPNDSIHPASVIKVPLGMMFFDVLRERETDDLRLFLVERGVDGRTYQQLLYGMLVDSEEDATESIFEYVEDHFRTVDRLEQWGYEYTTINPRRTTATEITRIFEDLWQTRQLTEEETDILLEFLAVYTSGDDTRVGVIREQMPPGSHFFSKRGSLVQGRTIVAEVAILEVGETAYVASFFGYPGNGEDPPTYEELEAAIEDAAWVVWGYLEDIQ